MKVELYYSDDWKKSIKILEATEKINNKILYQKIPLEDQKQLFIDEGNKRNIEVNDKGFVSNITKIIKDPSKFSESSWKIGYFDSKNFDSIMKDLSLYTLTEIFNYKEKKAEYSYFSCNWSEIFNRATKTLENLYKINLPNGYKLIKPSIFGINFSDSKMISESNPFTMLKEFKDNPSAHGELFENNNYRLVQTGYCGYLIVQDLDHLDESYLKEYIDDMKIILETCEFVQNNTNYRIKIA